LQPQIARDAKGILHLACFKGDPAHGDILYTWSNDDGNTFSSPIRVNSQPGSAVATGTIRGAQIAVGKAGRVHVAWNGSSLALPKGPRHPGQAQAGADEATPMLYARLNDSRTAFEPQRNLITRTFDLDGGGSVAADQRGNVYVAWHASAAGSAEGESGRQVWVARSNDEGERFEPEQAVNPSPTGACGCCGLRIFAGYDGTVYLLYRSATESVHRDVYLLVSRDGARNFRERLIDKWEINACPMSSMDLAEGAGRVLAAWQTKEQVFFAPMSSETMSPISAPGKGDNRKYSFVAANNAGETILVWTEATRWARGGTLAWQVFDKGGQPTSQQGSGPSVPVWSFGTGFVRRDGNFAVLY
jgi:hypothetical protein